MKISSNPVNGISGVEIIKERTRTSIAFIALCSYIGLLFLILIIGWWILKNQIEDVLKVLSAVAGILSGIVGAIIGYYFRENTNE